MNVCVHSYQWGSNSPCDEIWEHVIGENHPSITIHISRAQNSIWLRESPDHKQIADLCGGGHTPMMLFGSENYSGRNQQVAGSSPAGSTNF